MGGFVKGLFGIDDKTGQNQDRARQLSGWDAEWNNLNNATGQANKLFPQAYGATAQGMGGVGAGLDYWKSILSGRQPAAAAMAPQINAVTGQVDATRQAQAQLGTGRGGGVAATNQQADAKAQQDINQLLFAAQPQAAQGVVQAGQAQAGIGAQQLAAALQSLGLSAEQIQHIVDSSVRSQPIQHQLGVRNPIFNPLQIAKNLLGIGGAAGAVVNGVIS